VGAQEMVLCGAFRRRVDCAVEVIDVCLDDEGRCFDGWDIAMVDIGGDRFRSEKLLDVGRVLR
jgi:hypothetical protein